MPLLAPVFDQPGRPLVDELDDVIVAAIVGDDRSLQDTLGPSEMGCPRCIGRHYLGHEKLPETQAKTADAAPWLPWLGTAMHAQLESVFRAEDERLQAAGHPPRWVCESRVPVGVIDGRYLSGSMDLFDLWTSTVIDWKLVGSTKLTAVRRKNHPGGIYRNQAHIYGRGMRLLGYDVERVAIRFLPRNAIRLSQGYFWTEPFDYDVAERAVENVENIAAVAAKVRGDIDDEIAFLLRLQSDPDCFSCDEYPPLPGVAEQLSKSGEARHPDFDQPTPYARRS